MSICKIWFEPFKKSVKCNAGAILRDIAIIADLKIASGCGGEGVCGQCLVHILDGHVSLPTDLESDHLDVKALKDGKRLACQTHIMGDVIVYIPPASLLVAHRIDLTKFDLQTPVNPIVKNLSITLDPQNIDSFPIHRQLVDSLFIEHNLRIKSIDIFALRGLSDIIKKNKLKARIIVRGQEIIDVCAPCKPSLGLAIDIGTSKIESCMMDMNTGKELSVHGIVNPQVIYGDDVMSRITYAIKGGSKRLNRVLVDGLNEIIKQLGEDPERIIDISVAANTAIHHLLLCLPVHQLGMSPYQSIINMKLTIKARDMGLNVAPGAYVYMFPPVSGFIGGDHVALILATGIYCTDKTVMAVDIGTNTEIVLAHDGKLTSCSVASGPAFEGTHIKHGMRAASGAIEGIDIRDNVIEVKTINDDPAIGICGSGVLDVLCKLKCTGLVDNRGRLKGSVGQSDNNNNQEIILVSKTESGNGQEITISEKDIREIQLAKAAIRAGVEVLLRNRNICSNDLDEFIIAGAFGTHINVENAITIGMFPPIPLDRFKHVGNAALSGAIMALISRSYQEMGDKIVNSIHYLGLMTHPDFPKIFAHAMYI